MRKKFANQARTYAEQAEFEALRNGAKRESVPVDPLSEPSYAPSEAPAVPATGANPTTGVETTTSAPSSSTPTTPTSNYIPPVTPKKK